MFDDDLIYECSLCGLVYFDHFMATNCCSDYKNSSSGSDVVSDSSSFSGGDSGSSDCGGGCD